MTPEPRLSAISLATADPQVYANSRNAVESPLSLATHPEPHAQIPEIAQVAAALKGQTLDLPNLFAIYPNRDKVRHPDYEMVRAENEDWLSRWVPDHTDREKQRKVDVALLGACFWPRTTLDKYRNLTDFLAWYFYWDDEIDCGTLKHDQEGTEKYRKDSLAFLQHCLEPDVAPAMQLSGSPHHCDSWTALAKRMQVGQTKEALRRFANALYDYVNAVCDHQQDREIGLSTVERYMQRRLNTIGALPCGLVLEWAYDLDLPSWVYDHESTKVMLREMAVTHFLYNDLVSLKKEVAKQELDSIIPILVYRENLSPQAAVERVVEMLQTSYRDLVSAEMRLLHHIEDRNLVGVERLHVREIVEKFVAGVKDVTIGGLHWT